jgi:hypothetical protein
VPTSFKTFYSVIIKPERIVDQDNKFDPKGSFLRAFAIISRPTFERHMLDIITDEMPASAGKQQGAIGRICPQRRAGILWLG